MHNELRELEFFVAVARAENFSRAAESLYVSQPALSRGTAQLEARLGTQLFTRTTRRVTLTAAGAQLLPAAEAVLDAAQAFHAKSREIKHGGLGLVRLGVPPNVDHVTLANLLANVSTIHPEVEIVPTERPTDVQVELLHQGTLDIGLLRQPFDPTGLDVHDVLTEPLMVAVGRGHHLADRRDVMLSELNGERLVTYLASSFVTAMLKTCADHGFQPSEVRQAAELTTQLALIASRRYVALLPRRTGETGSDIVTLPIQGEPVVMRTSAAWVHAMNQPRALVVKAVVESITADPTLAL